MSSSSSSSLSDIPLKTTAEPQVSVLIKRNDLKAARYHGLRKVSILGMRNPFFKRRRVFVEAAPNNTQDRVFYVPPVVSSERIKATPTQYITVNPTRTPDLVRQSDSFEISFIGMSATPFDKALSNNNELLLYSLSHKDQCDGSKPPRKPVVRVPATSGDIVLAEHAPGVTELVSIQALNEAERAQSVPSNIAPCPDLPFIHYDPVVDGHDDGTEPDAFVPIPASKRRYKRYRNVQDSQSDCRRTINVRFTLMEIDKISDLQARSISGVDRLGSYVSAAATGVPYMELLTKAFAVAANLGKDGLNAYSKPDHVLSVDIDFMLADDNMGEMLSTDSEAEPSEESIGNYLRYGYYYFLNRDIDAKLYAQTSTSSQHMPLMMRRTGISARRLHLNEQEYFPLTGYSYVVIRVTRGCTSNGFERTPTQMEQHRRRLDNMLQMSDCINLLASMNHSSKSSYFSFSRTKTEK